MQQLALITVMELTDNSSEDEQIAAMCYIKWLTEKSGFAESEGGISIVKGMPYPETLSSF